MAGQWQAWRVRYRDNCCWEGIFETKGKFGSCWSEVILVIIKIKEKYYIGASSPNVPDACLAGSRLRPLPGKHFEKRGADVSPRFLGAAAVSLQTL